jgi:hypothetical protein
MASASSSPTPNPNAMKFTLDIVLPEMVNATDPAAAAGQPLAQAIFAVDGVVGVFGTNDFVTVSKTPEAEWQPIVAAVTEILRVQV